MSILDEALRLFNDEIEKAFNPNQPRAPKGTPIGGQWVSEGGDGPAGHAYAMAKGIALKAATTTKNADMKKWMENKVAQVQAALENNDAAALDKIKDGGVGKVKDLLKSAKEALKAKSTALSTGAVVGATGQALKPEDAFNTIFAQMQAKHGGPGGSGIVDEKSKTYSTLRDMYLAGDINGLKSSAQVFVSSGNVEFANALAADLEAKQKASELQPPTAESFNSLHAAAVAQHGKSASVTGSGVKGVSGLGSNYVKTLQQAYLAGNTGNIVTFAEGAGADNKAFANALVEDLKSRNPKLAEAYNTVDKLSAIATKDLTVDQIPLSPARKAYVADFLAAGNLAALEKVSTSSFGWNGEANRKLAALAAQELKSPGSIVSGAITPSVPPQTNLPPGAITNLNALQMSPVLSSTAATMGTGLSSIQNPVNISGLVPDGPQQGSNPGGWYKDPASGERFYIKRPKTDDHVKVEVLTAHLAGLSGVEGPQVRAGIDKDGKLVVVSRAMQGASNFSGANDPGLKQANKDFAFHAWTANWDAIGQTYDNQLRLPNGAPATVDFGGSLIYRAQGGTKNFTSDPLELTTMRDPAKGAQAAKIFGDDSPDMAKLRRESAIRLAGVSEQDIASAVKSAGLPPTTAASIENALIARRQTILNAASFDSLKNGNTITPYAKAFYTPSEIAAAVPNAAAIQTKTATLASTASKAASTAATAAGPKPPQIGETISYFQFVKAGPSDSPFRQALATAPRLKQTDLPGFTQLGTSQDEVAAIKSYQGSSASYHNELRVNAGANVSPAIRQRGNDLSNVIARSVVTSPSHIVREVSISPDAFRRLTAGVGMEYVDPGFVGGSAEGGSYGVNQFMRINLPPGAQAAALRRAGNTGKFSAEGEVLIQRNSRFRIVRAEIVNGQRVLEVDWIGVQPTNL